jgi:DNA-binding helix-hairpin-helix protein with protein kinase domain
MVRLQCKNSGEWIDLVKEINSSGEGKIYATNKTGFLAKIYHNPTPERSIKLQIMANDPPADPTLSQGHISIAWPKDLLQDSGGSILGFLMPEIKNGQTLIKVYNPRFRNKQIPGFNWVYLHITAMNVASTIDVLHNKNYVVCDIKQQNLLLQSTGQISIIDTDSFQIRDKITGKIHRSHVGSGEYTPPEMFNVDFTTVDRSELHDRFGLAIIIWQLLFGNHPFSGEWVGGGNQPNIDKLIHQGDWIYGKNSKLKATPLSIPLNVIHPELERLFRKCFDDGYRTPYARPSAADWKNALEIAIPQLTPCSSINNHYYARSYAKYYWCQRKIQISYDAFPAIHGSVRTQIPVIVSVKNNSPNQPVKTIQQTQTLPIQKSQPVQVTTRITPSNNVAKPAIFKENWKKALITGAIFIIGWIIWIVFF